MKRGRSAASNQYLYIGIGSLLFLTGLILFIVNTSNNDIALITVATEPDFRQELEKRNLKITDTNPFNVLGIDPLLRTTTTNENSEVEILSWKPRVFKWKNFLTIEQCKHLKAIKENDLDRSLVVGGNNDVVSDHRTSSGAFFDVDHDPVIIEVDKKISKWVKIPPTHFEAFYLLRYQVGEQYKSHYDWFDPIAAARYMEDGGQRTATVIISLDPPKQGGETRFEKVDLNVKLDQGDALLFYNRFPNGTVDPLTLHSGLPVLEGEKWIITKWIRERPYNNSWYSKELNRAKPNPNAVNPFTGLPDGQ